MKIITINMLMRKKIMILPLLPILVVILVSGRQLNIRNIMITIMMNKIMMPIKIMSIMIMNIG